MFIDSNTFHPQKFSNRVKLLFDFLVKRSKTNGLPLEIGIEPINFCNLRCIMCPHEEIIKNKIRPPVKMTFLLFKKIIDEIATFTELVYLHGLGEPLLHPKIFEFVNYAKNKNLRVGISTNAMLLNKKRIGQLLDSGIDYVILALDGATKKTYEKIRIGGDFEQVEKNIRNFLREKSLRQNPPFTLLQFIIMDENSGEADLFLKKWGGKGANVIRLRPKLALRKKDKAPHAKATSYCFHLFRQLNIYSDGAVVPCCEDVYGKYLLGNTKYESLKDLWNGKKIQILRQKNFQRQRNQISLCRNCHYPQPTLLEAIGVLTLDQLTVKKILPSLEKLGTGTLGSLSAKGSRKNRPSQTQDKEKVMRQLHDLGYW